MHGRELERLQAMAAGGDRAALRQLVAALHRTNRYEDWHAAQPFPMRTAVRLEPLIDVPCRLDESLIDPTGRFVAGWKTRTTLLVVDTERPGLHATLTNTRDDRPHAVHPDGHRIARLAPRADGSIGLELLDARIRGRRRTLATRALPGRPMALTGRLPEAGDAATPLQPYGLCSVVFDADGAHLWVASYETEPDAHGEVWPRLLLLDVDTLEEVDAVGRETLRWWHWDDEGAPCSGWGEAAGLRVDPYHPEVVLMPSSAGDSNLGILCATQRDGRIERELLTRRTLSLSTAAIDLSDDLFWSVGFTPDGTRVVTVDGLGRLAVVGWPANGEATGGFSIDPFAALRGGALALPDGLLDNDEVPELYDGPRVGYDGARVDAEGRIYLELADADSEPFGWAVLDPLSLAPLGLVEPFQNFGAFFVGRGRLLACPFERGYRTRLSRPHTL